MNQPLHEITNIVISNTTQNYQYNKSIKGIHDILQLTVTQIDYGNCLPNSIHQRKIGLIMKQSQQFHIIISLKIQIDDQELADLSDYIFGVRKQSSCQYFDDYKFKATLKGIYNFMVGVKAPRYLQKYIEGRLVVRAQNYMGSITVNLRQFVTIPKITCIKQLVNEQNLRLIKFAIIASKSKRQIKISFKYDKQMVFNLQTQLLSLQEDNSCLQVKPKLVQSTGKGIFILSLIATYPPKQNTQIIIQRRILTLKLKDQDIYYHFPVEVTFYPDKKKNKEIFD